MRKLSWFERVMSAVTFAEANEHDIAKTYLTGTFSRSEEKHYCKECNSTHGVGLLCVKAQS